jgi:hypothetical protein
LGTGLSSFSPIAEDAGKMLGDVGKNLKRKIFRWRVDDEKADFGVQPKKIIKALLHLNAEGVHEEIKQHMPVSNYLRVNPPLSYEDARGVKHNFSYELDSSDDETVAQLLAFAKDNTPDLRDFVEVVRKKEEKGDQ